MVENPPQNPSKDRAAGASTPQGTRPGFPAQGLQVPAPEGGWSLDEYNPTLVEPLQFAWGDGWDLAPEGDLLFSQPGEATAIGRFVVDPPFDLSSITDALDTDEAISMPDAVGAGGGLIFNPDRDRIYSLNTSNARLVEMILPEPNTLTGFSIGQESPQLTDFGGVPTLNPDGTHILVGEDVEGNFVLYELPGPYDLSSIENETHISTSINAVFDHVSYQDDGNYVFADWARSDGVTVVGRFPLGTPYDPTTIQTADQLLAPYGLITGLRQPIFPDGQTMWSLVRANAMPEGWYKWEEASAPPGFLLEDPVMGARRNSLFSTTASGLAFDDDGSKLFALEADNAAGDSTLNEYNLGVNYNIQTVPDSPAATIELPTPMFGIQFRPDGTMMYLGDFNNGSIVAYELTTAFSLDTASLDHSGDFETQIAGFTLSPPGAVAGGDGNDYQAIVVSDPASSLVTELLDDDWDVSTGFNRTTVTTPANSFGVTYADSGGYFFYGSDGSIRRQPLATPYDITSLQSSVVQIPTGEVYGNDAPVSPTFPDRDVGGRLFTGGSSGGTFYEWTALGLEV